MSVHLGFRKIDWAVMAQTDAVNSLEQSSVDTS